MKHSRQITLYCDGCPATFAVSDGDPISKFSDGRYDREAVAGEYSDVSVGSLLGTAIRSHGWAAMGPRDLSGRFETLAGEISSVGRSLRTLTVVCPGCREHGITPPYSASAQRQLEELGVPGREILRELAALRAEVQELREERSA